LQLAFIYVEGWCNFDHAFEYRRPLRHGVEIASDDAINL
jgi:hypothetical protein